ncbi:capping protein-inhibiting regulator of actin dynamics [Vipera latastei]
MGTRAFSHESVFMPDGRAESEESIQAMSQDNLVGKVKTLQQQLAKNIKFGQPSQMTVPVKAPGEVTASLEADGLLNNPMETVMPPDVVLPENYPKSAVMPDSLSPTSLGETSRDRDEKVTPVKVSSRPKRHHSPSGTIETVNLDAIPLATVCLDNSAAKHKLSVRPKNQRVSKKHRLSKEVQSVIETDFEQDILESQGSEDKMTKDDGYYRPGKLIQHGEVQEQKTEGKRKQNHWINLEAGKKEEMAEAKFKSPVEHKRFQEFEGVQVEQVGGKPILQEEQLYQMEEKKDQEHQAKGLKEQEKQGRNGEGLEKLQAEIPKKSQDLEEQKQRYQEQAQHEQEAQRQQEERKPHEVDTQWQKEKKKKQQELEAQRQQGEAKRQGELEVQRQQQEEEQRQCELEVQRQYQEEARKQHDLEIQRQRETEQKRQHELEVQRQQEEEKRQRELELQRQREEEQKRQRELELQRQREEEQKRQRELELQRQWEEEQKRRRELELQKQREEEQKRQRELELQRQREEEQKRQRELELQRQREEEQKRHRELELQRQWEEEQKRRRELELQRQREEEQKRQRELELQRQREEEQKRQRELELQRQREEEQKRHRELELQRQWEEEQKRQRELELQRQREEEQKRQRELELQRQWEEEQKRQRELELQRQREEEQKRQRELELQRQWEEEQQKRQREVELQRQREEQQKRQCELELQRQREEEQKRERELELQRQLEEEQKRQCELEVQRQHHEEAKRQRELDRQRQREEEQKRQCELELQRQREEEQKRERELDRQKQQQEEQKRHEQEAQRPQEEKKRQYEQEEQRHKDCMIQKQQNIRDPKEEKRHQETEQNDSFIQQGWKDKKKEPEKQKTREEKISHPYLGKQVSKELKTGQSEESENQQLLQEQKRELGQRKKEQESSKKLDDRNKLQEKGTAMKVKGQEEQQHNLNEFSTKEQKLAKSVGSAEHRKVAPAEPGHLWAGKEVQQEEFIQRTEDLQLERQKILCLEDQQSLEKPKEEKESNQLHMSKHPEDECLESVEKELQAKEEAGQQQRAQPGKEQTEEGSLRIHHLVNAEVEKQERVLGEELRWQEVDAGQTTSRGFTFQVSSGEKEIIFPKVNLNPVTPVQEAPLPSATKEFKDPKSCRGSSNLPTSLCVPHTAILVTGAQLCGTAVNLNQIKDTACKSLLGLTEEKKGMDAPQPESIQKPVDGRPNSTKVKHVQDSVDNQAILDEWASIRSKILKGAENDKFNEKDNGSLNRHSDDWTAKGRSAFHGNLRKTLSANAKFSITPAWQKFSEMSKTNTAAEDKTAPEAENAAVQLSPSTLPSDNEAVQTESPVGTKNVGTSPGKIRGRQEVAGNTEGCKFAKDLPSFLVPSLPYSPNKELSPSETSSTMETQQNVGSKKIDRASPSGEENVGPFGVKLRRTNYYLRFHYDQQAEQKKKKRYSAGDSFDGLPTPLVTPDNEQDAKPLFLKESKSLSQERKDAKLNSDNSTLTIISRNYTIVAPISCPTGPTSAPGQEKTVSKSPLPPKPALAPKPISQTPPSSPLSKPRRAHVTEPIGKRVSKVEPDTSWRKSEGKGSPHPSQAPSQSKNEEEESREKKSFFPSITMPWREKAEKKPEPLKKERPILQSRHSIDGSKVMEKGETAQPLWITLALQKQKGFREQQATREERRQAREAKQAEKLAKENASVNNQLADNKSNNMSKSNILQKSTVAEEEKKIETATSRFERREQLKKSNTLPSSVTVEITDSLSSSPLAKEVTKRFSTPDANPVSTEPAWLALAKRKAKAWSDCPQIIK